jgi:pyruvate/2-oxoglutarate dehydrogenase complex dihydrolipoamide dehydrogenase (E3) component
MSERADVIVLGMGPGGEDVAGRLAEAGLDVVGIEKELVGGECPYWGCIPSKMIIRAANLLAEARRIPGMAGASTVAPDWAPVAQRIRDQATDNWNDKVAVDRFVGKGGRFVRGAGRVAGAGEVTVEGVTFQASRGVVIATGTSPSIPPVPGLAGVAFWTNHDLMQITQLPVSMVVLGGGAVGLEMAQALSRFGVRITVVEAAERVLPLEEPEAGDELAAVLTGEGIDVRTGRKAVSVEMDGDVFVVNLQGGERAVGEKLLVATGRRANLAALGVDSVGIDPSRPWIPVDARLRAADAVWAVGDVTGVGAFTHIAMYQSAIAAADILGEEPAGADYRALPRVTFTDPEVASAGLTEAGARSQGITVRTGSARVAHSARGWIHGPGNEGFIKLIEDGDRGVLVGATSVGPWGGEVLSMLCLAVHAEIPTHRLRRMIYAYPTFHRGVEDALRALVP